MFIIKIGITVRAINEDTKIKYFVRESYLKALEDYPYEILFLYPNSKLDHYLEICDGFIIPGGNDIHPKYYQENNTNSNLDEGVIDELDKKVIEHAFLFNKPLLGICRGIQAINVFLGGTLSQDIKNHENTIHYLVTVNNGKLTGEKERKLIINSFHHQAIKKIAKDFVPLAVEDNVIEIMEHKTKPIIGVQYHPELMMKQIEGILIFNYFYTLVKK